MTSTKGGEALIHRQRSRRRGGRDVGGQLAQPCPGRAVPDPVVGGRHVPGPQDLDRGVKCRFLCRGRHSPGFQGHLSIDRRADLDRVRIRDGPPDVLYSKRDLAEEMEAK